MTPSAATPNVLPYPTPSPSRCSEVPVAFIHAWLGSCRHVPPVKHYLIWPRLVPADDVPDSRLGFIVARYHASYVASGPRTGSLFQAYTCRTGKRSLPRLTDSLRSIHRSHRELGVTGIASLCRLHILDRMQQHGWHARTSVDFLPVRSANPGVLISHPVVV